MSDHISSDGEFTTLVGFVHNETPSAVLFSFEEDGQIEETYWLPLSQTRFLETEPTEGRYIGSATLTIPDWLAERKDLIDYD